MGLNLTTKMKCEIVEYCVEFSKGVIEDGCPEVIKAYDAGEVTRDDMEEFVQRCKAILLAEILTPTSVLAKA
jgi:hypothetical protein